MLTETGYKELLEITSFKFTFNSFDFATIILKFYFIDFANEYFSMIFFILEASKLLFQLRTLEDNFSQASNPPRTFPDCADAATYKKKNETISKRHFLTKKPKLRQRKTFLSRLKETPTVIFLLKNAF